MKKNNLKKIFSAFAVLAISTAAAAATIPFAACEKNSSSEKDSGVLIDTAAYGEVVQRTSGKKYFVAANGNDENSGESIDSPKSIKFITSDTLAKGDTVYVLPGEYTGLERTLGVVASGEFNSYIRIINAALDKEGSGYAGIDTKVTLDFSKMTFHSTNRGVQIYGDYIYWYGIDVCGAGDNGIYVGGNFNTVEYCEFYNNRDTGLQLGRSFSENATIDTWPNYNLIKNCTSHNNYDNETYGENADGFAAKLTVGYGNVFDGCIAYRNSDDGWDLYAKTESGNIGAVIMYNCVAYENGYLEYTQRENNARFGDKWNSEKSEDANNTLGLDSYKTRDGDGNGFKLGGSVMDGDVVLYNCLSFQNRMHGVTDNSNPGFIKVQNVTSYDNSAAIWDTRYVLDGENNPTETLDPRFGNVVSVANHEAHSNIDVARQTYSYNSLNRILSVKSSIAKSLSKDEYRGSVTNSLLLDSTKCNVVDGSIDADTKPKPTDEKTPIGPVNTKQVNALVAADVFKSLPIVLTGTEYTYTVNGARNLYTEESGAVKGLNPQRDHFKFRNADGSVNMGDILAQKDTFAHNLAKLGAENHIGSVLNLSSWNEYTHFYAKDFTDAEAETAAKAKVERAKEALTLNTEEGAVYQNFEVPVKLLGCTVEWSIAEGAEESLEILKADGKMVVRKSPSGTEYATVKVTRPSGTDAVLQQALVATIKSVDNSEVTAERKFDIKIIAGKPEIGKVEVHAYENKPIIGETIPTNELYRRADHMPGEQNEYYEYVLAKFPEFEKYSIGSVILDRFSVCEEPEVKVQNALYDDVRYIKRGTGEGEYSSLVDEISYGFVAYQPDADTYPVVVPKFTPSNAGIYTIFDIITINDTDDISGYLYKVYVASSSADVAFVSDPTVTVNRSGFVINGEPTNATGTLFVLASPTELTSLTAADLPKQLGVQKYSFRGTQISHQFANANSDGYYVYSALANADGKITSELYQTKINKVDIATCEDFMKIAGGETIGEEEPNETIYLLTKDLDFTEVTYARQANAFKGLLNGMGHTVSGITIESASGNNVGVFHKVDGGTIENVKFKSVKIEAHGQKVALVTECTGGYFYNIAMENVTVKSNNERVAGLIAQVGPGTEIVIDQVSLVNDDEHLIEGGGKGRIGGLVAFSQANSALASGEINISLVNCYVNSLIKAPYEVGGIFGTYDCGNNTNVTYNLSVKTCAFVGKIEVTDTAKTYAGGILGYQKGAYTNMELIRCLSLGTITFKGEPVVTSMKNCSGIVGCFNNTLADGIVVKVDYCTALMEEYNNAEFIVTALIDGVEKVSDINVGYDKESWTFVFEEGSEEELKAPYLTLNFLSVAK